MLEAERGEGGGYFLGRIWSRDIVVIEIPLLSGEDLEENGVTETLMISSEPETLRLPEGTDA